MIVNHTGIVTVFCTYREADTMPVHKVNGGYKFGKSGKTYRGKGAKKKAQKRERAIYASGYREKKK